MRIICPTCASHYEVEPDKVAASGQLVRCAQCREVWLVRPSAEAESQNPAAPPPPVPRPDREPTAFAAALNAYRAALQPIDFASARSRLRRRGAGAGIGRQRRGSTNLVSFGAVCAAALGLMLGFRAAVVTHFPLAAPAYAALGLPVNIQGLAIRDVRSVVTSNGGKTVLSLEGEIANLRDQPTAVPNLTVVVRDDARVPLYTWIAAAPKAKLGKGETVLFRSRLDAPPAEGRDVRVSFSEARRIASADR